MPRLIDDDADIEIDDGAEFVASDEVAHREHVRAEAQLKVDRGGETAFATAGADGSSRREVRSHRLLDQGGGAGRKPGEDGQDLIARDGDVEHRIVGWFCRPSA